MTYEKRECFSPLLESANQIHLTIYLQNNGDLSDLKRQLRRSLAEAEEGVQGALGPDAMTALLLPIRELLRDGGILKQLKGHIGIFRTSSSFRVLSIPVEVKPGCHIASTFHVKPLLRWMQWDCEFLLLGIDEASAHLYMGSQEQLRRIDSILYPSRMTELLARQSELANQERRELNHQLRMNFSWVSDWITESAPKAGLKLFVAGERALVEAFIKHQDYKRTVKIPVAPYFHEEKAHEIAHLLRALLRAQTKKSLEQALLTFKLADEANTAERNIRVIAQAAVQGRVKKLVIAENREIFGKLDPRTGRLLIHPFDLDHEDDDLLDDLAQRVLISGGEVFLAKKEEIPNGRPILAILETEKSPSVFYFSEHPSEQTQEKSAV